MLEFQGSEMGSGAGMFVQVSLRIISNSLEPCLGFDYA
jgi:hypothetical protein